MPVRKITTSRRSFVSYSFSDKNNRGISSESTLEKDFVSILEFDPNVIHYEEQPVCIHYQNDNRIAKYTPDFLVVERVWDERKNDFIEKSKLIEIKYRADLKENWSILKPKFQAAIKYCGHYGWTFKILTEVEIRTSYLNNIRFLQRFRNSPMDYDYSTLLKTIINELKETTPEEVLLVASNDLMRRAELLYVIWAMISRYEIKCDLTRDLSMNTLIWINE